MTTSLRIKVICTLGLAACLIGASIGAPANRTQSTPPFHILLIGISGYKDSGDFGTLSGEHDMAAIEEVLKAKYPAADIDDSLCADGAATKANILAEFAKLTAKCKPGDAVYVAFAGHGTQVPDTTESTGIAQAFIPYDGVAQPADDPNGKFKKGDIVKETVITGPEFNTCIKKLRDAVKDSTGLANITLTFDSCHSGSITRSEWKSRGYQNPAIVRLGTQSGISIADEPQIKGLVCLGAAQPSQLAWENGSGGVFTNALLAALKGLDPSTGGHSYQSLFEGIRANMALANSPAAQTPDLLGEPAREVFSTKTLPLTAGYLVLTPPDPNDPQGTKLTIKMNAGAAFGINAGDRIGIFKPGTEDLTTTPLATGVVATTGPTSSFLTLDGPTRSDDDIKALGGNVAFVTKAAPAGQLKVLVNGELSPATARLLSVQPDITLVGSGETNDVVVDAPPASGGPALGSINVTGAPPISLSAADFDAKLLDNLEQIRRFKSVQGFGAATKRPEVIVEMRLVPIKLAADGQTFAGIVGDTAAPISGPVTAKRPFLIQVRAYSLNGDQHVKGVFDPYIAILNGQPNWVLKEVWPGDGTSAASTVQAEDHKLIADDQWHTLGATQRLYTALTDAAVLGTFNCDASTDGEGAEFWEVVATPTSVDYSAFLAPAAARSASRGGGLQTPDKWSTATVTVQVVKG